MLQFLLILYQRLTNQQLSRVPCRLCDNKNPPRIELRHSSRCWNSLRYRVLELEVNIVLKIVYGVSYEKNSTVCVYSSVCVYSRLWRDRKGSERDEAIVFRHAWQREFSSHSNIFIPADLSTPFHNSHSKINSTRYQSHTTTNLVNSPEMIFLVQCLLFRAIPC